MTGKIPVAIIGAGPAGLFSAYKLTGEGIEVAIFNRDIKPGGMAEYGIYPTKRVLKDGLRRQFEQILACERVHYYGNLPVGNNRCLSLSDLISWGIPAILVASGAQGTKWLGIPGETLNGVYHAKDLVYHYNRLPPYSTMPIHIGKRVVIVGAGNVMADVTRYLITLPQVEEVHICVRRGPAEIKFTRKELETIIRAFDLNALEKEIERVAPVMLSLGQNPEEEFAFFRETEDKGDYSTGKAVVQMHFLVSPTEIRGNADQAVKSVVLEENTLVREEDTILARGVGILRELMADTVIFAIGDRVESDLGLPLNRNEFLRARHPAFPIEGQSYEVEDPRTGEPMKGIFLAGWARVPSSGLVGNARKDGVNAAEAILNYLGQLEGEPGIPAMELEERLANLRCPVVRKEDLRKLIEDERQRAVDGDLEKVKYRTNEEMLKIMGLG
ncbi:MAG: FAD-dependent oxidoreductase [Anaerolineaceae bacterium]|nr:FAD-dependent oxidoreductase [Anaerolineaceae bacterium]